MKSLLKFVFFLYNFVDKQNAQTLNCLQNQSVFNDCSVDFSNVNFLHSLIQIEYSLSEKITTRLGIQKLYSPDSFFFATNHKTKI